MVIRAAIALVALGGCTLITDSFLTNEFSGDPFPVDIDTASGAIVVGMRQPGQPDRTAVLDLLSPITVADPGRGVAPSLAYANVTLLGQRGPGGALDLPRAQFVEAQVVSVHPCVNACDEPDAPAGCDATCQVGAPGALVPFTGILGADALAGDAVRLRLGANQLFVLPDIGGSSPGRSLSCEAVFDSPYRGGGTMVIGGTELPFGGRRLTVQACLAYGEAPARPALDPDPAIALEQLHQYAIPLRQHGADAVLVVSTGIGVSLLDESAYARYVLAEPDALPLDRLPAATVYLPSGAVSGRRATIKRIALIGSANSNPVAPCRQVHAHHVLSTYVPREIDCADRGDLMRESAEMRTPAIDCPCDNGDRFCDVPAVLELHPAPQTIDFLIVADTAPVLQALRTELRPDQPEVDGLLGTGALGAVELDVDYPHDRLIARCAGAACTARPELASEGDRCQVNRCSTGDTIGCP